MRGILAVLVTVCLGGCFDTTPEERVAVICDALCKCNAPPLPSEQQLCVSQCQQEFAQVAGQVGDSCVSCVESHVKMCATLENDCDSVCQISPPPPPPEGGSGSGSDFPVDAGIVIVDAF
jgi:hypothetical protein